MIIKSADIKKIDLKKNSFFLLYGVNEGFKQEIIKKILEELKINNVLKFDEKEIIENDNVLFDEIFSKSLFDDKKIIIINRATNKITSYIEKILEKKIDDTYIFINSENLEKKSKLRGLFEKNNQLICIPFYTDTTQILTNLAINFLKKEKINISQSNINLIIGRCNGDRGMLKNELNKIALFGFSKKTLSDENIFKLTNLTENYSISELIDHSLAKNIKKTMYILNENKFSNEDCIIIIRTLLNKSKKILKLSSDYQENKNMNLTISTAKPPIFWKDKEIIIQQINKWTPENIRKLIYRTSEIELILKKNLNNSLNLISNFILELALSKTNN